MLRGLYSAASGMITQQRRHDTISNNIANLNTPGYKGEQSVSRSFPETLMSIIREQSDKPGATAMGYLHLGVMPEENISVYVQGDLQETNHPFDFALVSDLQVPGMVFDAGGKAITPEGERIYQPQAFFTVETDDGQVRYTRNGKFTLNTEGELVTAEGFRVLGIDGLPLQMVNPEDQNRPYNVKVGANGQLYDGDTQQPLGTLLISRVENPHYLIREGYGLYRPDDELDAGIRAMDLADPTDQYVVKQGFYERSNVDPTQSMVDMMSAARVYEANQKVIQTYDRSLDKAVNEIGRV